MLYLIHASSAGIAMDNNTVLCEINLCVSSYSGHRAMASPIFMQAKRAPATNEPICWIHKGRSMLTDASGTDGVLATSSTNMPQGKQCIGLHVAEVGNALQLVIQELAACPPLTLRVASARSLAWT